MGDLAIVYAQRRNSGVGFSGDLFPLISHFLSSLRDVFLFFCMVYRVFMNAGMLKSKEARTLKYVLAIFNFSLCTIPKSRP